MTRMLQLFSCTALIFGVVSARADDRSPGSKPVGDAEFVKMAASDGMHEVELGKIAMAHAKSDAVKKFAERMVKDHTKANMELKSVAKAAGIEVPAAMTPKDQKHVDKFKSYSGSDFDADYVKHMVVDHEKAVALFTHESKDGKNQAVREFATKTLPTLQSHLEDAKKLKAGK